jgi:hypothetical protein
METRSTGKSNGTLTMKRVSLLILESYKVEGKLSIASKIVQIMWNVHKEFPIHTFESIPFSSSSWEGHELEETLATTMYGHERLQAKMMSCRKESSLLGSSMGFGMGFWKRYKLGSMSIFRSYLL